MSGLFTERQATPGTSEWIGDKMGADTGSLEFLAGNTLSVGPGELASALKAIPLLIGGVKQSRRPIRGVKRDAPYPIWDDPKAIAKEAENNVADPSPLLKTIGTSREEMEDIARGRYTSPDSFTPGGVVIGGRGSAHSQGLVTTQNTERMMELLDTLQTHAPSMTEGMLPWYIMDPAFRFLEGRHGTAAATEAMERTNIFSSPMSAGSPVDWEVQRGILARDMDQLGIFDFFENIAGQPGAAGYDVPGHPYASSAQLPAIRKVRGSGQYAQMIDPRAPKVHSYHGAAIPGQMLGFQTAWPVGDAHWARGVGLADVRGAKNFGASASGSEIATLGPWFRDLAAALERPLPAVPAQALQWGGLAKRTGVESKVGATKLEFFLDMAQQLSAKEGIPVEDAIDRVFGVGGRTFYGAPGR